MISVGKMLREAKISLIDSLVNSEKSMKHIQFINKLEKFLHERVDSILIKTQQSTSSREIYVL